MNLGASIVLSAIIISTTLLFVSTKDRWNWDFRTWAWNWKKVLLLIVVVWIGRCLMNALFSTHYFRY